MNTLAKRPRLRSKTQGSAPKGNRHAGKRAAAAKQNRALFRRIAAVRRAPPGARRTNRTAPTIILMPSLLHRRAAYAVVDP